MSAQSAVHVRLDWIGCRTEARKILMIASNRPPPEILILELRDAKTGRPAEATSMIDMPRRFVTAREAHGCVAGDRRGRRCRGHSFPSG